MRLATRAQAKEIDERSAREYLLQPELLMEAAGALAAREIEQSFLPEVRSGRTVIVCGPGHNGADGLVVARHLHSAGYHETSVVLVAPDVSQSELFQSQLDRVFRIGVDIIDYLAGDAEKQRAREALKSARLIVDGLFGIGLNRPLSGVFADIVNDINLARKPVAALDAPSGLDVDTGRVLGGAVKAQLTVSFGVAKPGYFTEVGPSLVGRVRVVSIGFPQQLVRSVAKTHLAFSERLARRYLPNRAATTNKARQGHLVVIAGSEGMPGAASLCALAGARMGVGYTTICTVHKEAQGFLKRVLGEAPGVLLPKESAIDIIRKGRASAYVVGPGLQPDDRLFEVLLALRTSQRPVVADAGALAAIAEGPAQLWPRNWVFTPHLGELSRLLKRPASELETDRFLAAQQASRQLGGICLLKGYRTVLGLGQRALLIMAGNSALAKAGTGDVLSGLIGGLMAQGVPSLPAGASGAFIHGRLADDWVRSGRDKRSLLPTDLTDHLPLLLKRLSLAGYEGL